MDSGSPNSNLSPAQPPPQASQEQSAGDNRRPPQRPRNTAPRQPRQPESAAVANFPEGPTVDAPAPGSSSSLRPQQQAGRGRGRGRGGRGPQAPRDATAGANNEGQIPQVAAGGSSDRSRPQGTPSSTSGGFVEHGGRGVSAGGRRGRGGRAPTQAAPSQAALESPLSAFPSTGSVPTSSAGQLPRKDPRRQPQGRQQTRRDTPAQSPSSSSPLPDQMQALNLNPQAQEFIPGASPQANTTSSLPSNSSRTKSRGSREPRNDFKSEPRNEGRREARNEPRSEVKDDAASESSKDPSSGSQKQRPVFPNTRRRKAPIPKGEGELMNTLITELSTGTLECMVCYDVVSKKAETWSCKNCFAVFHLSCIRKWASKSTDQNGWRCPGCQKVEEEVPKEYLCFCGQIKDPEWDFYGIPHGCSNICSRVRVGTACPHPCTLRCHPGPCPSCKVKVPDGKCFCGKTSYSLRCGEFDKGKCCEAECGKSLSCNRHRCEGTCHPAACPPCTLVFNRECYCRRAQKSLNCGLEVELKTRDHLGYFSCEAVCGRDLACGNHKCQTPCHAGECPPCDKLSQYVKTCPCGMNSASSLAAPRKSCLDPIPTCNGVCGKALRCVGNSLGISDSVHLCQGKCHTGDCPPCTNEVKFSCRCRSTTRTSVCSQESASSIQDNVCKRVCRDMRSCGKHQCNVACCTKSEDAHRCKLTCNKKLQCGLHNCARPCHKGHCYPCLQANFDEVSCYCGETRLYPPIPCGTALPRCQFPCSRQHSCSHAPNHSCHAEEVCPPCVVSVVKPCACYRKLMVQTTCSKSFSNCGRPCEKSLSCGHLCPRICHDGPCEVEGVPCKQSCGRKRKCGHKCQAVCHRNTQCPPIPCASTVTITCKCQRKIEHHICGKSDESNPFGTHRTAIPCDDVCIKEERDRKLARAFDIHPIEREPDVPEFHRLLFEFCSKNLQFALKIEETFKEFVRDPKKQLHHFAPMKKEQRGFIHLLSLNYGFSTESVDPEPHRSVIIRKKPETKEPHILLTTLFKRNDWLSMPLVSQTLSDPLEKLLEKPEKQKEKSRFQGAVNAVLMTGVDSSISVRDLREVVAGFLSGVAFEIERLDATTVVVLPDSLGSDVTLLEGLLTKIVDILKAELPGVFSNIVCCWVNSRYEVSIPEEKKVAPRPAAPIVSQPPRSISENLGNNSFTLLSEESEPGWEKPKKGKAKETTKRQIARDVWSDASSESLSMQPSEEALPPPKPDGPSTSAITTSSLPQSLLNFNPKLPAEADEDVVDDWTQLLPEDLSESEE